MLHRLRRNGDILHCDMSGPVEGDQYKSRPESRTGNVASHIATTPTSCKSSLSLVCSPSSSLTSSSHVAVEDIYLILGQLISASNPTPLILYVLPVIRFENPKWEEEG